MHGPGAAAFRIGPRDTVFDGEVDLECAGAPAEPPVGAGNGAGRRSPRMLATASGAMSNMVTGRRELRHRVDARAGLDLAAQILQRCCQRVGDGL